MSAWWIIAFYLFERSCELRLARRNRQRLFARGGREYAADSYRGIVLLHLFFFAALIIEAHPWRIPLNRFTGILLFVLSLLQILRYWCIVSLGDAWNTRIIVVPGVARIRRGPYRRLRHPNYMVVVLEFAGIPLLLRAPITLFFFSLANLILLRRRIALEEFALAEVGRGG